MIRIPKRDAFKIRELCGWKYVKHTHSKHKTYYLVEHPRVLKVYEDMKENINTGK